jgi:hypothetical protein
MSIYYVYIIMSTSYLLADRVKEDKTNNYIL